MAGVTPAFRAFRVGPKNRRFEDPSGSTEASHYDIIVDTAHPLPELLRAHGLEIAPDDAALLTPENFAWPPESAVTRRFEIFDFSFRSEYGRSGVDEAFVRDKLEMFRHRPATLAELICFAGHLREVYRDQWFESKTILALGSPCTTREVVRKAGWFSKEVRGAFRHYPQLECVSGRPVDLLRLSRTAMDQDGNWPNETLFLATPLA
jgi:hypothetical protein